MNSIIITRIEIPSRAYVVGWADLVIHSEIHTKQRMCNDTIQI